MIWSCGLRDLLGVGLDVPDEKLAQDSTDETPTMAMLSREEWHYVVQRRWRALLLDAAQGKAP